MQEGGIRVPFILRWPAQLEAGRLYTRPVGTLDLYPTFCAAAAVPIPEGTTLDGVNLLPHLRGTRGGDPHDTLFWKTHNGGVAREGDWKLLIEPSGQIRLFHLAEDLGERYDLSAEKPEIVRRLHQAWKEWSEPLPPAVSARDRQPGQ